MHNAAALSPQSHRACAACGGTVSAICHHQRFVLPDGYPLPAEYNVVACLRCGFVYADPAARQLDYDRFYCEWSKYDDAKTATGSGVSRFDAARLATTTADIARALPSRNASILDVGCATGGLLAALRDSGFTAVAGLDPSPHSVAKCRDRGFEAYVGSISNTATFKHMPRFDCVVFSHVLEHVYDIPAFFAAARRLLAPGGYLYIETPDATGYADYLYAPFQEFSTEHINHFSRLALENTTRRHGFEPVLVEQKVIQTAEDTLYPAVFGLFRDNRDTKDERVVCDQNLSSRIAEYIRHSTEHMERIDRQLTEHLADSKQVIVWGAGQLAMKLLLLPCIAQPRLRAVVDSNPILRGKTVAGALVIGPEDIASSDQPIVIATLLHAEEIRGQIRRLGLANPIILLPLGSKSNSHFNTSAKPNSEASHL